VSWAIWTGGGVREEGRDVECILQTKLVKSEGALPKVVTLRHKEILPSQTERGSSGENGEASRKRKQHEKKRRERGV